jgi:hypothetical protein
MDTIPKRKIKNLRSQSKVGEATLYGLNLEFAIYNLKSDGSEINRNVGIDSQNIEIMNPNFSFFV